MNKAILKKLRETAKALPLVWEATPGQNFRVYAGKSDTPGKIKVAVYKDKMPVNHYRRMKAIYEREGAEGVRRYTDKVLLQAQAAIEKAKQEQAHESL